jgi:type I restriction-modification system DNA methylase subunit
MPKIKQKIKKNNHNKLVQDWGNNFQTPQNICHYMASFLPKNAGLILEPTAGKGNLVKVLQQFGNVFAPDDFYKMTENKFDWIVMNPPFTPMKKGYEILYKCMEMSDNIIALMPYLTIINGEKRTNHIMNYGLKSITHLPRSVFKGSRVQTCILEMSRGYKSDTVFRTL